MLLYNLTGKLQVSAWRPSMQAEQTRIFGGRHVLSDFCTLRSEGQDITSE